ncbi:MAG: endonuclease/exonuclease/phosphatase family protein [Acidimicrobiales bacterium]
MRVASFNLHAGIDGWGRATRVLEHASQLGANVLVCPELWRGDQGPDLFDDLCQRLGMRGLFVPLARGERVRASSGGRSWLPWLAHFTGEHGLYFQEHRELTARQRHRRSSHGVLETGEWGLGLVTDLPIEEIRAVPLGRLTREKVNRYVIVARLCLEGRPFYVLGVHGAHLSHGSFRQYRELNRLARDLEPALPTILAGDFNCWRPLLRLLLPGWRSMVRARTWPAKFPHSQIDHILARGPWTHARGWASEGGSDHRALVANIEWAIDPHVS